MIEVWHDNIRGQVPLYDVEGSAYRRIFNVEKICWENAVKYTVYPPRNWKTKKHYVGIAGKHVLMPVYDIDEQDKEKVISIAFKYLRKGNLIIGTDTNKLGLLHYR